MWNGRISFDWNIILDSESRWKVWIRLCEDLEEAHPVTHQSCFATDILWNNTPFYTAGWNSRRHRPTRSGADIDSKQTWRTTVVADLPRLMLHCVRSTYYLPSLRCWAFIVQLRAFGPSERKEELLGKAGESLSPKDTIRASRAAAGES